MNVIDTKNAPGAIGPYSQAYEANGFVITSGQIPVNPADGTVPEGIAAQAAILTRPTLKMVLLMLMFISSQVAVTIGATMQ